MYLGHECQGWFAASDPRGGAAIGIGRLDNSVLGTGLVIM
jgi:hypothetical protein